MSISVLYICTGAINLMRPGVRVRFLHEEPAALLIPTVQSLEYNLLHLAFVTDNRNVLEEKD